MAKRRHTSFQADVPFKCEEVATPSSVSDKPRKLQQRSTRTRALLLKAAEEIFVSVGYEKAALADIAHTAGKTRGAIYSHFKDKEEIFLTLVEKQALKRGAVLQEMLRELKLADGLSPKSFQRLIGSVANPQEGVLLMEFLLYALRHPHLTDQLVSPQGRGML